MEPPGEAKKRPKSKKKEKTRDTGKVGKSDKDTGPRHTQSGSKKRDGTSKRDASGQPSEPKSGGPRKNKKKSLGKKGRSKKSGRKGGGKGKASSKFILAVDLGTTGVRSLLIDDQGSMVPSGLAYEKITTLSPEPGLAEQDPEVVWEKTLSTMKQVLDQTGVPTEDVVGIGLSTQRGSVTLWNKNTGKPVYNCLTWQDVRTQDTCNKWNKSTIARGTKVVTSAVYPVSKNDKMGIGRDFKYTPLHSTPRIHWLLQLEESQELLKEGSLVFGTIDTWILYKMTGGQVHATDFSNVSATGLWQPFDMSWNTLVFKVTKLPKSILPRVLPSQSTEYGELDEEHLGIPIPIRAVIADQPASLYSMGCLDSGQCKATLGTGGFVDICTGNKPKFSPSGMVPLIAWMLENENKATFMSEANATAIGSVVDWACNQMGFFKTPQETADIALSVSDTKGVYFVPSFNGLGPPFNCEARGTILGLTVACTPAHLVRAILEGLGFTMAYLIIMAKREMKKMFVTDEIKVDGGVARNDFVCQFMADISGCTIVRSRAPAESTGLGVSYLVGTASDIAIWTEEDIRQMRNSEKTSFKPTMEPALREKRIAEWTMAVDKAKKTTTTNKPF